MSPYLFENLNTSIHNCFSKVKEYRKQFDTHQIRYRINGSYDDIICRHFLWLPKRFNDGWHWLTWAYTKHKPLALDWFTEWMSKDEFLLFKLSNNLEKVK